MGSDMWSRLEGCKEEIEALQAQVEQGEFAQRKLEREMEAVSKLHAIAKAAEKREAALREVAHQIVGFVNAGHADSLQAYEGTLRHIAKNADRALSEQSENT